MQECYLINRLQSNQYQIPQFYLVLKNMGKKLIKVECISHCSYSVFLMLLLQIDCNK